MERSYVAGVEMPTRFEGCDWFSDHGHWEADQFLYEIRQSIGLTVCGPKFDCHVLAFNEACFL
jgi:hypothetical protein